ncbi:MULTISPECIES: patatin-like phospholipase family protein [Spirulina sp. CCY15215]|uniref:patatin-like phospholipase family protein n=1 Tax=Spirulina sp. CCY15215 TaxID=2767591 RepID=UPI0019502A1B|nr:patatin-like phospholipase family protein [Spirulina major]
MTFKILSLDGGGMRGALSARILQAVEIELWEQKKLKLHEYFDAIAGVSTGSILAAGLAKGKTCQELLELYQQNGDRIFPKSWKENLPDPLKLIAGLVLSPKYTHQGLEEVLQEQLENTPIKAINKPILHILAYDTFYRNTTRFTNFHPHLGDRWYDDTPLWKICVASSSAPTFFPPYELTPENQEKFGDWKFPHIDGGVAANNPTLSMISEALLLSQQEIISDEVKIERNLKDLTLDNIAVLSIGTGNSAKPFTYQTVKSWKTMKWASHIGDIFMAAPQEIDSTVCQQLMGGYQSKRYLRLQFDLNDWYIPKPGETFRDPRNLIPVSETKNRFTGQHVSEIIDDGSPEAIEKLIATGEQFVEQGKTRYSRVYGEGDFVKVAIANFIKIHN